jgi:hypothetical protein
MLDANLPQLILQLDQLGEVGDDLRLARLTELHGGENQPAGNGEGR